LLSALLFPGWGQLYLKKYKRGLAIILPVAAGTIYIVWAVVQVALAVLKATPFKKGSVHFSDVVILSINSVKALDLFYLMLIIIFIILLWIFSTVGAYFLGKKEIQSTVAPKESI
jgi:TM2 domain-containing membrane protein YozV